MSWNGKRYEEPIDLFAAFSDRNIDGTFGFIMDALYLLCEEEKQKTKNAMPPAFRYTEKQIGVDYRLFLEIVGEYMGNKTKLSQDYGLNEPSPNNKWARLFFNSFYAKTLNLGFAGFYSAYSPFKSTNPKLIISHYASYVTSVVLEYKGYYVEMATISMLDDRLSTFSIEKYNRLALSLLSSSPKMASGKGKGNTPAETWEKLKGIGIPRRLYK
jgi:hypothetical protein